ncbi:MAG: carbohydrate kinase family protein [Alicyclobacillus sp.]|nr:carbohydrate kinase family protein [Alicyclobacillus sp.]
MTMPHAQPVKNICILGNLNIDLIIRGITHFPEWGQEVSGRDYVAASAGQAGNLALALSHLGLTPTVVANVGDDPFGRQIVDDLKRVGVDISSVEVVPGGATGITVGMVRTDGERAFVSDFASMDQYDEDLVHRHWDRIEAADIVCMVGIFCLPSLSLEAITLILQRARALGKTTVLDTGWDPAGWPSGTVQGVRNILPYVSFFLPNLDEACVITEKSTEEAAADDLLAYGADTVVVKCGKRGSYARTRDKTCRVPSVPTVVFDTVGAGDTFNAGFVVGLSEGWPLEQCLQFGNAAASIYVSREKNRWASCTEVIKTVREAYGPMNSE